MNYAYNLRTSLCDYSDAYMFVSGTITTDGAGVDNAGKRFDERNKGVRFKNCAPFIQYMNRIITPKKIMQKMPMYNLKEYNNNYSKESESLWQYYRDEPAAAIATTVLFKFKATKTGKAPTDGNSEDVKIEVPLTFKWLLENF